MLLREFLQNRDINLEVCERPEVIGTHLGGPKPICTELCSIYCESDCRCVSHCGRYCYCVGDCRCERQCDEKGW
jgi:hypothetical protein